MKVHILFQLQNHATGGGNQFLRGLKEFFVEHGLYSDSAKGADVILFNSHQYIKELMDVKLKYPDKVYIHRIDGPMRLYNKMSDRRDHIVNITNQLIADGTIFQSEWSKKQNFSMGTHPAPFEVVIPNASQPEIFNTNGKVPFERNRKTRIIATSWSSNWKKGFEVYKWLDENLDFEKYELTFVGNSPVDFNNIIHKNPMESIELANELKKNDIYLTASQKDPCSNSLIEALHCGLPAVVLNDGGHPEILGHGGEVFEKASEIPDILGKICADYENYQRKIDVLPLHMVGERYKDFIEMVYKKKFAGEYTPKVFNKGNRLIVNLRFFLWGLLEKIMTANAK